MVVSKLKAIVAISITDRVVRLDTPSSRVLLCVLPRTSDLQHERHPGIAGHSLLLFRLVYNSFAR